MNRLPFSLGALALAFAATSPVLAADAPNKAQLATIAMCKKLTPAAAKQNVKCVGLMEQGATNGEGAMMSGDDHMMSGDNQMMSAKKPK